MSHDQDKKPGNQAPQETKKRGPPQKGSAKESSPGISLGLI